MKVIEDLMREIETNMPTKGTEKRALDEIISLYRENKNLEKALEQKQIELIVAGA